ncbi:MAG TPA: DUF1592 domain-containing protein [Polyangiaceae bacterium]|nr:DUF1592 domain-containing protein [Polyangiaceae bacterium]
MGALSLACTGEAGGGAKGGGPSGGPNPATGGSGGGGPVTENPPVGYDPATLDPGHIPAHRLSNTEYNNTVGDLLGTALRPADFFQAQTVTGFDTNAGALTSFNATNATAYFDAAKALVDDLFANAALKAKVLTCQPAVTTGDAACAQTIIETFGRLAYRRPLEAAEVTALVGRYDNALTTLGKDHDGAMGHVLRIMLTSAPFLYWIEVDPDIQAAAAAKRALTGYELATRLSYTLWSSMPDLALLDLNATLADEAVLTAQVDRLLDDPKGQRFIDTFFNQWLNVTKLGGHSVDATTYPTWTEEMRAAMFTDAHNFFSTFVFGGRSWAEFLTAPLDTSTPGMTEIYAGDPVGLRKGFLGLPAFLTAESMPTRTAPTFRGKVVLESVMCAPVAPPPNVMIPDLVEAGGGTVDSTNIRAKLEAHRASPDCAGCHAVLDPIGLGIETFDAIGRYRTAYENGDPIDTTGEFLGQPFNGVDELIAILNADERFAACPGEKALGFSLRRTPRPEDAPYVEQLGTDWKSGTIRDLVKRLVLSDTFRFRKLPQSAL